MLDLKERRKLLGYTLEEVAEMVGVSKTAVFKWETGGTENMKRDKIAKLAKVLEISPLDIVFDRQPVIMPKKVKVAEIPILGRIACGSPLLAEENIVGYGIVDQNTIKSGQDYFYLRCNGDSMEPTLPHNSLVLVRKQEEVESGEVAAILFLNDCTATLKRIRYVNNQLFLMADNNNYDPIIIDENNPVRIVGKAIQVVNRL